MVQSVLVDARNFNELAPRIIREVSVADLTGFDIESEDSRRHEGLNLRMLVDEDGKKSSSKRLVFDTRRTTVCGFSLYPNGGEQSYYVNLHHADEENRLPWPVVRPLLDCVNGHFVAHNAPFELTMMKACFDYEIKKIICTLQMAVSAYGPDEYNSVELNRKGLGGIKALLGDIAKEFRDYDPATGRNSMTPEQAKLFAQVIAKESDSEWSYNGLVDSIAYHYDLKRAIRSWFGVSMTTFDEVLGDNAHMGQLTGEQVVSYGADDSFWAVKLYGRLLEYMLETNPPVVETFFSQENPMVHVYSDVWREGMQVNLPAIEDRRRHERGECAKAVRELKAALRARLPFVPDANPALAKHEPWYQKNFNTYRIRITNWANLPDSDDDFEQVGQIAGAVSSSWRAERGMGKSAGPNFTHYMMVRTLLYDLMGEKLVIEKGKLQSDSEGRGKIQNRMETAGTAGVEIIKCIAALAGIEQRMKLYLTPYIQLTDPETQRMYPVLSSKLATRRMATSDPNPMQLAKRGESTYVRGFFLPDNDDHVILSRDWSGLELVLIGDQSGDPEFKKAFGQLPYEDMHAGTAAAVLGVEVEGLTEEIFKGLKSMSFKEIDDISPRLTTNLKGETMTDGSKIVKYWRTEIGKGANFNYFYSGALATVGERMGWSSDTMWAATERYRTRFNVAEAWRVGLIAEANRLGFTTLPDGHRRVRYECTDQWRNLMLQLFEHYNDDAIMNFGREATKAIRNRAGNQIVNSRIQGTNATLTKRTARIMREIIKRDKWDARFMIPIHDELLYSVHREQVLAFSDILDDVMRSHIDIVKTLPLHSTAAIGLTFEPFGKSVPIGQIELDEAPEASWLPRELWGKSLDRPGRELVLDYLFSQRSVLRKAA